jgi:hypothetical protein
MTARPPLDPRSLELLSVYLDGRLSDKEKATLEDMLEKDAGLRAHLDELRAVREQLRALPLLHPPRGLTLTPAMIGGVNKPRALSSWPMALGSALAALAFLFLISRDLSAGRMLSPSAASAPFQMPQAAMLESEHSAGTDAGMHDQAPVPTSAAPTATAEETPAELVLKAFESSAPEATAMGTPTPAEGYGLGGGWAATEVAPLLTPMETPPPAEQDAGVGGGPAEPPSGAEVIVDGATTPPPQTAFDWESLIPEIEVILVLVAVLLGVLAVRNARLKR